MGSDHYFTAAPASPENFRHITATLAGREVSLVTAGGVFSPDHLDTGTAVLLSNTPPAPTSGHVLDLGCGWGPISIDVALQSPDATVWAVDVNERALDLVRRNAESLGITNINAVTPDNVPSDIEFRTIRSNPPIRVGKNVLHDMLRTWIPRIELPGDAWFVVARSLGSDSLQRWLGETFPHGYRVSRAATARGFRVIEMRRHPETPLPDAND